MVGEIGRECLHSLPILGHLAIYCWILPIPANVSRRVFDRCEERRFRPISGAAPVGNPPPFGSSTTMAEGCAWIPFQSRYIFESTLVLEIIWKIFLSRTVSYMVLLQSEFATNVYDLYAIILLQGSAKESSSHSWMHAI